MTVIDNVAFGLRSRGVAAEAATETALRWLRQLDVGSLADRSPRDLSGGEAQRVALARALAVEPEMLLLDEPLSAVDVGASADLRHALFDHLEEFAGPRLLVTHDPTEAFLLADDVVIIESGRMTQRGTPDEIRVGPRTRYAAELAGINLIRGTAAGGIVTTGSEPLHLADGDLTGPVLLTIHPTAISVHVERPGGSPRNVWRTTIERVEVAGGGRVRLGTGDPLRLAVEVTEAARTEMGLAPGRTVWLAVKATEVIATPDD